MVFDGRFKLIRGYVKQPLILDMDGDSYEGNYLFWALPATRSRLAEMIDRVG
jgi:hypothetical protein